MSRAAQCGWFVLLLLLVGCTKDEDYLNVIREQLAAMKELADILETVKDESSMAQAKKTLDERSEKFAAISRKANALPKPPPPEVLRRMDNQLQAFLDSIKMSITSLQEQR